MNVLLSYCLVLSVSASSWCVGRAAVCDFGTPWTFLLPFFLFFLINLHFYVLGYFLFASEIVSSMTTVLSSVGCHYGHGTLYH